MIGSNLREFAIINESNNNVTQVSDLVKTGFLALYKPEFGIRKML